MAPIRSIRRPHVPVLMQPFPFRPLDRPVDVKQSQFGLWQR